MLTPEHPDEDNHVPESISILNETNDEMLMRNEYRYNVQNEQLCELEYSPLIQSQQLVKYRSRWLMLLIFSLNTMMNGILFISLSPIQNIMVQYYRVPSTHVEWLSNTFLLAYIILALPASFLINRYGVQLTIISVSFLHFLATVLRFAGCHQSQFFLVVVGQVFGALAYCMVLQIPGKLSSQWFDAKESATATSIGVFMNLLGVSIGFLHPTLMVDDTSDMKVVLKGLKWFFLTQMLLSVIIMLLTIAYKERPPTPPTLNSIRISQPFCTALKSLFSNKQFILLSQSYGIYFGVFVTFSVLTNPLVVFEFPRGHEKSIGWMGFACLLAAILSCFLIGLLLDRYPAYRVIAVTLNLSSLVVWSSFIVVLTHSKHHFNLVFLLYVFLGVFGAPYYSAGIEQAAQMTHPISEVTSSTIILVIGNFYGFLFILTLGVLAGNGRVEVVGYTLVGLYVISTVLAVFTKTELKRYNAEQEAQRRRNLTMEDNDDDITDGMNANDDLIN